MDGQRSYVCRSYRYSVRPQISRDTSRASFLQGTILFSLTALAGIAVAVALNLVAAGVSAGVCDSLLAIPGEVPQPCGPHDRYLVQPLAD